MATGKGDVSIVHSTRRRARLSSHGSRCMKRRNRLGKAPSTGA